MTLLNLTHATWELGLEKFHYLLKDVTDLGDKHGGMESFLASDNNIFTIIAPTDEAISAFEEANPGLLDSWRKTSETANSKIRDFLFYHFLQGKVDHKTMLQSNYLRSYFDGKPIAVRPDKSALFLGKARVLQVNLPAKNGLIHTVDSVLVPESGWDAD